MKLKNLTLTFVGVSMAVFAVPQVARAVSLSVIADGLDNPRNFAFAPDGSIYLTTSGKGGDGADGRCIASPSAQYIPLCAASNGSLLKIAPDGTKTAILPNLTSIALTPSGEQAAGPADFKFDSQGNAYLLTGLAGNPAERDTTLKAPDLGKLYKVDLVTQALTPLADFGAYELANNADGTDLISNPYAFAIKGNNAYVVDGGANTIYQVGLDGSGIKTAKAFPQEVLSLTTDQFPKLPEGTVDPTGGAELPPGYTQAANGLPVSNQSVPTGITLAPDGSLTVSEYTYFPYPEGAARLWQVDDNLTTTGIGVNNTQLTGTEIATGFTQLTGVAYDPEGNLYALQHINSSEWKEIQQGGVITGDISGSIIKIAKDGTRETIWSGNGLEAASGLEYYNGSLYTSNRARLAGTGQLLKIDLKGGSEGRKVPEPATIAGLVAFSALATRLRKRKQQEELGEELLAKVETL
ncbi:PEP-CTERM exosortase interaction domain-containing protein [Calothrix sp. HK-06]|nr:PEP-CTERM exosortase interaction domain-containing protein [Calothrix sp. HK-06]